MYTWIRRNLKETVLKSIISWPVVEKQNIRANEVCFMANFWFAAFCFRLVQWVMRCFIDVAHGFSEVFYVFSLHFPVGQKHTPEGADAGQRFKW